MVSVGDALRHLARLAEPGADLGLPVSSITSHNPVTIGPAAHVVEAVNLMKRKNISSLPVVERGELIGIVAERDLIREITA
ncbi:MAG: cyclic nucleotide-binding/CBS domain-containing protein [Thermoproteus sp. AZ2]|uniref:Cyclic nucleotide-binding/CBS domain-containing protein n=1 Tax=Thermoproteus sp. AZ2 TaxID=1609232 RepID=A0ACC6V0G0_9CREN